MALFTVRSWPRRALPWGAVALVLAAAVATFAIARDNAPAPAMGKKAASPAPPPAPVELAEVRRGPLTSWLATTAPLEARHAATLVAERRGRVVEVLAEEGQWVAAGAALARLDDVEARLAVERAEVAAEMARRDAERARQLHGQGYLSDRESDDLELKWRSARVSLEEARHALSQTRVCAPFAGHVTARLVSLGETVTQGRECFRLEDFRPVRARLYFPERELARVKVGQPARLAFDAGPVREAEGRIVIVNPVVDRANGTFRVTVEVANRDGVLRPGAFARVRLETGRVDDAVLLPRRGVLSEDGEDYVFVARGDSAVRVPVVLGQADGDLAQVVRGVRPGERVVTVGQGGLRDGARIKAVSL
jgi:RND family efflux transporter MFP subunit